MFPFGRSAFPDAWTGKSLFLGIVSRASIDKKCSASMITGPPSYLSLMPRIFSLFFSISDGSAAARSGRPAFIWQRGWVFVFEADRDARLRVVPIRHSIGDFVRVPYTARNAGKVRRRSKIDYPEARRFRKRFTCSVDFMAGSSVTVIFAEREFEGVV